MAKYRQIYEKHLGKVKDGYVVHHLDFNHENDEIDNLVSIPSEIHVQYHSLIRKLSQGRTIVEHAKAFSHDSGELINDLNRINDLKRIIRNNYLNRFQGR